MPLKTKKGCLTCKKIHEEAPFNYTTSRLYKLIDQYHLKGMTLTAIQQEYSDLAYLPIRNHALKHQNPSPQKLINSKARESVLVKARETVRTHTQRRSAALEKLEELLEAGELKGATFTALAALLKQEADIEEKQKDRNVDILKIMTSARSGELQGFLKPKVVETDFDPWQQPAEQQESDGE